METTLKHLNALPFSRMCVAFKTIFGEQCKKWAKVLMLAFLHGMLLCESCNGAGRDGKEYFGDAPSLQEKGEGTVRGLEEP
jgi:hypothetical protein